MDNQELQKFIGYDVLTVSEAMQKIDSNTCGVLFILNKDNRLVGSITDGDIRRFLISGGKITESVIKVINPNPKVATSYEEAISLYHKKYVVAVPIIDSNGKIVGIYSDTDLIIKKHNQINIPVVINAGGKGTRLDPFTKVLPKPLIPIGEVPIIELIMREYQTYKCNKFHIIVNYKKDLMKAYFSDSDNHYDITWYDEERPLGTGGGLSLLKGKLTETFFFANCDVLLTANYEDIVKFHRENKNLITMVCAYKNMNIPYGVVEMGINGLIEGMKEKPLMSFLTNTGIYVVEPEVINDIEDGVSLGFPDIIEQERQKGKKVAVYPVSENDWMDMGQLPELEKMRLKLYGE